MGNTAVKNNSQTITVKTNEENPEPLEVIAKSIIDISDAFKKLGQTRLKRRVILLLIKDHTGVSFSEIEKVLDAATKLKDIYLDLNPKNIIKSK